MFSVEVAGECVPFVSEYTDCTEENKCAGCRKCQCNKDRQWDCRTVHMCDDDNKGVDEEILDNALGVLQNEISTMENKKPVNKSSRRRSQPKSKLDADALLGSYNGDLNPIASLRSMLRHKRSAPRTENKQKKILSEKMNLKKHLNFTMTQQQAINLNKTDINAKKTQINKAKSISHTRTDAVMFLNTTDVSNRSSIVNMKDKNEFINVGSKKNNTIQFYDTMHEVNGSKGENKHKKRSIEKTNNVSYNDSRTIKFYDTIDEINEDTLKKNHINETLQANKVSNVAKSARRSSAGDVDKTTLHIDFNNPREYNHINDNKIDTKFDLGLKLAKTNLSNYSQSEKNKELSKLVVNELKKGKEIIGDDNAPIISNITFTPENDTLTAMAFIAGNLLNKLWNMEKDGSHSSIETEAMKQEKITDLLDLFKEPLNLRQEIFLRNALEKLSSAINNERDISNISLCADIERAKAIFNSDSASIDSLADNLRDDKISDKKTEEEKSKLATLKAVNKINKVLELIKKFESTQKHLRNLKNGVRTGDLSDQEQSDSTGSISFSSLNNRVLHENLSVNEKTNLNLYGKILDKITKLLLPPRKYKKFSPKLSNHNILYTNENLKERSKNLYKVDLSNLTVSAKDKLILDYVTHMENNPDCVLKNKKQLSGSLPTVAGNILLNLSEFFKMKSFTELVNLLGPENRDVSRFFGIKTTTTSTTQTPFMTSTSSTNSMLNVIQESNSLRSTKEKLKMHLKVILEDLLEIQKAKGVNLKSSIDVADALPCIYNIMNVGQTQDNNSEYTNPPDPITTLKKLKTVLSIDKTRRSDVSTSPRPQSAAIWERIIKNIDETSVPKTRRTPNTKMPKSLNEIKQMIIKVTNSSIDYKKHALLMEVPPAEKLTLLKTFEKGIKRYINVLEDIKLTCNNDNNLPPYEIEDLLNFIKKAEITIEQDNSILNNINIQNRKPINNDLQRPNPIFNTEQNNKPSVRDSKDHDELIISRDQILNQLMKNRMQLYLKSRNDKDNNFGHDMNYNIATKILHYLEVGNYELAGELFKIFNEQQKLTENASVYSYVASTTTKSYENLNSFRRLMEQKKPLIQFEKPLLSDQSFDQDYLIKQLLNIKNMRP